MADASTSTPDSAGISAIVTAYQRTEQAIETIGRIQRCVPPPQEILVHVDGNQVACAKAIEAAFPQVRVLLAQENVGPGGGRNRLLAAAKCAHVASFDDDSYPLQRDFFQRIPELFDRYPSASILAASIVHRGESLQADANSDCAWTAAFGGGGCVYRRQQFLETTGYVPLTVAYGMEEVDLALRIIDSGGGILWVPWLQVFHNTDRSHHADARITAFSIANIALLAFLRYPLLCWPVGFIQLIRRMTWLVWARRLRGIGAGLLMIPRYLFLHRGYRATVSTKSLFRILALRRRPEPVSMRATIGEF